MIQTLEVSCRSQTYPELYRDTVFTIDIYPDMYHDTVSLVVSSRVPSFCVSAVARASLCLVFLTRVSLPMFHLKVRCRKCPMQKRVNWKASRVTSGTAYSCDVRSSVGVDQVGNLALSRVAEQVGNLEFSCCRPGWEPGALVVSTRWDLVILFAVER